MALATTVNAYSNNNYKKAKPDAYVFPFANKISVLRLRPRLLFFPLNSSSAFIRRSTAPAAAAAAIMKNKLTEEELQKGIANFYDESSGIWESIWGDHMHHGFYDTDALPSVSDHRAAQIRMVEEALRFAGLSDGMLPFIYLFMLISTQYGLVSIKIKIKISFIFIDKIDV